MATATDDFFTKTGGEVITGGDAINIVFSFYPVIDAGLGAVVESETVSPTNLSPNTPISVTNGEYRIDGGSWVSTSGTISAGSTVQIRHTASGSSGQTITTILDINGVKSLFTSRTA